MSLVVTGPEARGAPADATNLVLRAATWMGVPPTALTLEKHLPAASGIGGGSSDAAATIRALCALYDLPLPASSATLPLGADLPVCMEAHALRMTGVGDVLSRVPPLPKADLLLVNPRVPVPTAAVFAALSGRTGPSMPALPAWAGAREFFDWLKVQRNDLLAPAMVVAPKIGDVLNAIEATQSSFAGMSGSGATCFGLYPPDGGTVRRAREKIRLEHPKWWIAAGSLS